MPSTARHRGYRRRSDYVTRVKSEHRFRDETTAWATSALSSRRPSCRSSKMRETGRIWNRVTKTAIQGGVQIPVSTAKPTATWVAAGSMADKQKKAVTGNISFSYHKLQVRVAVELVAATVALPVFEATIADNIAEAMVAALDEAILVGTGTGQPLGIVKHTNIPAEQIVVRAADFGKYETWTELLGKVPHATGGVAIIMNDADWNKYMSAWSTRRSACWPGHVRSNGTIEERLLGRGSSPSRSICRPSTPLRRAMWWRSWCGWRTTW